MNTHSTEHDGDETPDGGGEAVDEKAARQRRERWDRETAGSGHEYDPTPETRARRADELRRDEAAGREDD